MDEFDMEDRIPVGVVLMTALPPTYGHKALIEFAHDFMCSKYGTLKVLLNSRSFEPLSGEVRLQALMSEFTLEMQVAETLFDYEKYIYEDMVSLMFYHCAKDDVPQLPHHHEDFWNYWKELILKETQSDKIDYVFASETYGKDLAKVLNAKFIPFDMHRQVINISGTRVREFPLTQFGQMLPHVQDHYRKRITFFGPESVGKSTMTRSVFAARPFNAARIPEWARDYLEQNGPEITDEKMEDIIDGQFAAMMSVPRLEGLPFILQDTDLLSTLGYYKLWKGSWPEKLNDLINISKSHLYILMNDQIPFTPDILRYGGDKRETPNSFWKEILDEWKCNYYEVQETDAQRQVREIEGVILDLMGKDLTPLQIFKREV